MDGNVKNADYVLDEYVKSESSLCRYYDQNSETRMKITYSAFHGVGYESSMMMFKAFGFPSSAIIPVEVSSLCDDENGQLCELHAFMRYFAR